MPCKNLTVEPIPLTKWPIQIEMGALFYICRCTHNVSRYLLNSVGSNPVSWFKGFGVLVEFVVWFWQMNLLARFVVGNQIEISSLDWIELNGSEFVNLGLINTIFLKNKWVKKEDIVFSITYVARLEIDKLDKTKSFIISLSYLLFKNSHPLFQCIFKINYVQPSSTLNFNKEPAL